ncbi:conserved unknown protein [Ectocarpus siliculosus]|uniref:C2 domain-containing protein n=1 Tax=Ectocarpus siliculosus TaxID=2880 RepID=D7FQN3_ECTSI|nr:conserved unknown protein [Ectocarpus siliculosus]|eukprot:CBJ30628.1 conserved unknown protein [Ectocarpus siliculosus]
MGHVQPGHDGTAMNHAGGQHEYACIAGGENHDGCDERGNAVNPIVDEADNYGWMDYRSISGWKFPAWPLLQPSTRAKMTIGTLHAKVVEARGLISRDFAGRSDPFAELELTGRYLSHGQEWSEPLRVREKTRVIKFSLNPVWNEEFSLPVRRAGAVLRIRLWDWNASIPDDPLGHIEVKMGGDLLAQKDGVPLHEPSIEERRESYGEVRLQLRFEFNELAETCSYIWPEEPPKRPLKARFRS